MRSRHAPLATDDPEWVTFDDSETPVPSAPRREHRPPTFTVAAVVVFVITVVALALVTLQPDAGQTAAGTQRLAPSTSPITQPASTVPPLDETTTTTTTPVDPLTFNSVVREPGIGARTFLALSADGDAREPLILRSLPTGAWEPLEVSVPEVGFEGSGVWVKYSNLIETDDGYAMLRISRALARIRRSFEPDVTVHRLRSVDGTSWEIDNDFEPLEVTGEVVPVFHDVDAFGMGDELLIGYFKVLDCENSPVAHDDATVTIRRRGESGVPETVPRCVDEPLDS